MCMFTVGIGLPLTYFIFFGLTDESPDFAFFGVFLLFGLLITWAGIANNKIFGDIVPQEVYPYIFALDRCIEGVMGSVGALATGWLTNAMFDFDPSSVDNGGCSPEDAHKLGQGIFTVCLVAWGLCFLFYTGLHFTYPKDRLTFKQCVALDSDSESDEEETSCEEASE